MKVMKTLCLICKNPVKRRDRNKYCSVKCMGIGRKKGIIKTCPTCKNNFYATNASIKKGKGKYCSRKCFQTLDEWKNKISATSKGRKHTYEWKKNMSERMTGNTWGFKKDGIGYWKNKTRSEETRIKISKKLQGCLSPKKGIPISEEHKKKISLANSGKKRTEEWKLMKSERMKGNNWGFKKGQVSLRKGVHLTEEQINNISKRMKGTKYHLGFVHTEEAKRKMSEKHKGRNIGKDNPFYGKKHNEDSKKIMREKRLHQIFPTKDTIPEQIVQSALTKEGISFEKHKPILGQPDIFIAPNICIFIDGCYFHGCEQCCDKNKMSAWIRSRVARDQFVTQGLINEKYIVLRFWEHEIKKNIDFVVFQIKKKMGVNVVTF